MNKSKLLFNLSAIFAIGFFVMSAELAAQSQIPPSDMEYLNVDQSQIPVSEPSKPATMSVTAYTSMMGLPPHVGTFTGSTRGYWFTAPCDFVITGMRVPEDASTAEQNIEVIRFNSGPLPFYPDYTNNFVSLGRWVNVPGPDVIACNIVINAGDIIGVLGDRGNINSYGPDGTWATSIKGYPVVLTRMGMQYPLSSYVAHDIWQEPDYPISRVEMYYEDSNAVVPIADWAIYMGIFLIVGFIFFRFRYFGR